MRRAARKVGIPGTLAMALAMTLALAAATAPAGGQTAPDAVGGSGGANEAATPAPQAAPPFTMNLGSRIQVRYAYLDRDEQDATGSFGIRRARLSLSGAAYERFLYAIQVELPGAGARLLDANIRYQMAPMATLWFGQGKAPFGRQQLTSSGNLHMVDRAITDGRFAAGRQQGIALQGQTSGRTFEYSAGVYNGNGINTANEGNRYMYVGRAVFTPFGAYAPTESAHGDPESARLAVGVAGLHNTVLLDEAETEITRLGLEAAFKVRGFNSVSEFFHERASPVVGAAVDTSGWYVQGGYLLPNRQHELAARYAVISPDTPTNSDTVEMGVGYSLYLNGHRAKVQTDLRHIDRKATDISDLELRVQFQLTL
jgi:phosphate-selective porin OprO and OprP